jgi:hypothetical protein
MLEFLMVHNAIIREVLNGSLFPLFIFLSLMIGHYLWDIFRKSGSLNGWRRANGSQTACVLFWLLLAEGIRSGNVWYLYRTDTVHMNVATTSVGLWSTLVFVVTATVLIATILRATYLFTPMDTPHREWWWRGSALVTIVLNAASVATDVYEVL